MTVEAMIEEIRTLPINERKRLISLIVDTLTEDAPEVPTKKRNILEFEGVGAEMWQGINAHDYLEQLRNEWDEKA